MRTRILIVLLTSLFASQLDAQTLLYRISGNELPGSSYLYGTMHVADDRVFQFNDSVIPAFESCDAFAMEMLMDELNIMSSLSRMMMEENTLSDFYTDEEYQSIKDYFRDSLKMPILMFERVKPMFVMGLIQLNSFGVEKGLPLDLWFAEKAKTDSMSTHGLESADEQFDAMDAIPLEDQAEYLLEAILGDTTGAGQAEMDKLLEFYIDGQLDSLQHMSTYSDLGPDFEKSLVIKRNKFMVKRMIPLLEEARTFVAVGALHLPGKDGIITLLRDKGYTVEPVY